MTKEYIGSVLKKLRIASGKTQKEVAETLGRKQQIVGHWETGYSQPDANTLFTLCSIYDTTVDEAFGFKEKKTSITKKDIKLLETFHSLDTFGQETINILLNREKARTEDMAEIKSQPSNIIEFTPPLTNAERLVKYFHSASAGSGVFVMGSEGVNQIPIPDTKENRKADYAIKISGNSMEPDFCDGDIALVSHREELNYGDIGIFIINNSAFIKEYGEEELISRNPDAGNVKISEYDNIVCMGKVIGKLCNVVTP